MLSELKAQGRNLNQLTILSHQGRSYPSQIERLTNAYEKWSRTAMLQEINIYYQDIGLLDNVIEQAEGQNAPQTPIEVA